VFELFRREPPVRELSAGLIQRLLRRERLRCGWRVGQSRHGCDSHIKVLDAGCPAKSAAVNKRNTMSTASSRPCALTLSTADLHQFASFVPSRLALWCWLTTLFFLMALTTITQHSPRFFQLWSLLAIFVLLSSCLVREVSAQIVVKCVWQPCLSFIFAFVV
jgi:hypothetical protein